ncbi:MAG: histidine phosphatase family protein [Peptostreptococcaceae bacterium]|nr:histidine phosphatase family protein [Peptostreptococcaceae bacterium]
MTDLYLIRHGQTKWNLENRIQGNLDSPLTALGLRQAGWLSDAYKGCQIDIIYTSTLDRAYNTAKIFRGDREIDIIRLDELKEINFGEWEGRKFMEIKEEDPEIFDSFRFTPETCRPIGGETFNEAKERVVYAVSNILEKNKGRKVALVIHGAVLKLLMGHYLNRTINQVWDEPIIRPTSVSHIRFNEEGYEILKFGDVSHYEETDENSFGV